jgi:hypothetical protein
VNNQAIQRQELAGKTKLTAVNIYISPSRRHTRFVMLTHDSRGKAILPISFLNQLLRDVPRGTTYTVG